MQLRVMPDHIDFSEHAPQLLYCEFPHLVEAHLARVPWTELIEDEGAELANNDFPLRALRCFIREVCAWGWMPQIASNVINNNPMTNIQIQFLKCRDGLAARVPDLGRELENCRALNGLGVAFASKHLRFLRPDICPILDSKLHNWYTEDSDGYRQLAEDLGDIADCLEHLGIRNPRERQGGRWYVGDVDMAIYAHLKGWKPEQTPIPA